MQHPVFHGFNASRSLLVLGALTFLQPSCSTLTPSQRGALLVDAETLASIADDAVTAYRGPAAGALASAGLSALGSVLEGYVGSTIPTSIVVATPGVGKVGAAVAAVVSPSQNVTQQDVNVVNDAAAVAQSQLITPAAHP